MAVLREWLRRLIGAAGRGRADADLQEELRLHADLAREQGRPTPGPAHAMDALRDQRGLPWFDHVCRDLRHGFRALRRAPAFAAAAVPTLALAIGATTAMFAVLNAVLLRPLPYPSADRLVMIWRDYPAQGVLQGRTAFGDVDAWRSASMALAGVAFFDPASATLTIDGQAEHVSVGYISQNLFDLVGMALTRGRGFTEEEATARRPLAIVSHGFWRSRLAGSGDAIGRVFDLGGRATTVVGVLGPEIEFPAGDTDLWIPYTLAPDWDAQRDARGPGSWFVIGRLAKGATEQTARAELEALRPDVGSSPTSASTGTVSVQSLRSYVTGARSRLVLWLLMGAVLAVLLLASANVAGLTLARNAGRAHEVAVRIALGASAGRIAGALLAESVSLAVVCGALALGIAAAALQMVRAFAPPGLPQLAAAKLEPRVFLAAALICLGTAVMVGLAPAFDAFREGGRPRHLDAARGASGTRSARRVRRGLVRGEFALAVVLLAAAGLLARSLWSAEHVELGFDVHRVLSLQLSTPEGRSTAARVAAYAEILDAIASAPGVERTGLIGDFVVGGGRVEAISTDAASAPTRVLLRRDEASPDVFAAVGSRLIRGRFFSDRDTSTSPRVAIVNETLARALWTGDPIDRRLRVGGDAAPWFTVVGVVADMRREGPEIVPTAQMFEPLAQNPSRLETLIVRSASDDPMALAADVRAAVHRVDPAVAIYGANTLEARFGGFLAERRLLTALLAVFSLYAALLAAVGIYGLVHYSVITRTRELAIRMAVGARPVQILGLVIGEGLALCLTGIGVGAAGGLLVGRIGSSLLFNVSAADPWTFAAVMVLLTAVALTATCLPARRTTRIDPMTALHRE